MLMTAEERIALVGHKIKRAKKHIFDLEARIRAFFELHPYKIGTKRNQQTRQLIYYLSEVTATPVSFSLIAGDAIQNLRSALDHLAQQLYLVGTSSAVGAGRDVSFFI